MSAVQPVAMRSAVFCIVCSLLIDVLEAICDQVVLAYSRMGLVIALYVVAIVSFDLPHCVVVSALRMLTVFLALSTVFFVCSVKFSLVSSVSPRTLGCCTVGIVMLLMCRFSLWLYSAGSGVKSVAVDLSGFSVRLLRFVQSKMSLR